MGKRSSFSSFTPVVQELLVRYAQSVQPRVRLVPWSSFPVPEYLAGNFARDPNTHIQRLGYYHQLNDCLYRARPEVRFVAQLDLDELVHVPSGRIVDTVQRLSSIHPKAANFIFPWKMIQFEETSTDDLDSIGQLNFDYISKLRAPVDALIKPSYLKAAKMIQVTDRVLTSGLHFPEYNEVDDAGDEFESVKVPEAEGVVLHLRKNMQGAENGPSLRFNSTFDSALLATVAGSMNDAFKRRVVSLQLDNIDVGSWSNLAKQTSATFEHCRTEPRLVDRPADGLHLCPSIAGCELLLSDRRQFVLAPQIWTNVNDQRKTMKYAG